MSDKKIVIFQLHTEEYGIEIENVKEIVLMQEITSIPQASDLIEGIINLRGDIIPIVDLKNRFYQIKSESSNEDKRIIVVESEGKNVGIIADMVSEVITISSDMIEPPPFVISSANRKTGISGICKLEDKLVILLDLFQVFTSEEQKKLEEVNEG